MSSRIGGLSKKRESKCSEDGILSYSFSVDHHMTPQGIEKKRMIPIIT